MAEVVIIGDDLTGSNATGALYAINGLKVVTVADIITAQRLSHEVDVLVFNTASRHLPESDAAARVRSVVEFAAGIGAQIVKRVDTTLRGNIEPTRRQGVSIQSASKVRTISVGASWSGVDEDKPGPNRGPMLLPKLSRRATHSRACRQISVPCECRDNRCCQPHGCVCRRVVGTGRDGD